jgi:hypothetical protein
MTDPKLNLHKFYFDGITRARKTGERYCQAMFNHLHDVRPDLAEQVRGTDKDPFYCPSPDDPRWDRFVNFIETNWYLGAHP